MATKAEQSDATRRALVAAARALFAEHGFADTSTEAVVQAAGVTRGALYHHFRDKTALFQAVYKDLEQELLANVARSVEGLGDPLTVLRQGAELYLDVCLDPAFMRVVLLDGPSVLGWEAWREIDQAYALGMVKHTLEMAIAAGAIADVPAGPLAHTVLGALTEGSLYLANAPDKDVARVEVGKAIGALIDGLAAQPARAAKRRR
jgi:AcrR family transcriptional regulator